MNLIKGQRVDLIKDHQNLSSIKIGLGWDVTNGTSYDLDASVLLLDSNDRLGSSKDIVFYNNLSADNNNIKLSGDNRTGIGDGDDEEIIINLQAVSSAIQKMVICITIHNACKNQQHFGQVSNAYARIIDGISNKEVFRYSLTDEYQNQTALILGEVYRRNDKWKFSPIGRGLDCSLENLCADYGAVNLANNYFTKKEISKPTDTVKGINLSKIELKKSGDSINLNKTSNSLGEITVNLNWNQQPKKSKGLFSSLLNANSSIDLDLGCLFELKCGLKGCVQALGNSFGSYNSMPYISLDADDRTGASLIGENLRINGNRISEFRRILIFSYIYGGVANWSQVDGVVTLKTSNGDDITVRMDESRNGFGMCSIALLENLNDETFKVEKAIKYFKGHKNMDVHFKWGLHWTPGRK